jgi:hypothetical protein
MSTPTPSSPVLPPMPPLASIADSGFMSGGIADSTANFEDSKMDDVCLTTDAPVRPPPPSSRQEREKVPVQLFRLQGKAGVQDMVQVSSQWKGHGSNSLMSSDAGLPHAKRSTAKPPVAPMGQPPPQTHESQEPQLPQIYRPQPQAQLGVLVPVEPPKPAPARSRAKKGSSDDKPTLQPPPPRRRPSQVVPNREMSAVPMPPARTATPVPAQLPAQLPPPAASQNSNRAQPPPPSSQPSQSDSAPHALPIPTEMEQPALPLPIPRSASTESKGPKLERTKTPPVALPLPGLPSVPASDPIGPPPATIALPSVSFSEAPCPPSDALIPPTSPSGGRSNKNLVKKQSIKEKLLQCIDNGEMPPYCSNCGAIETPTWRKINTQDVDGIPEYFEYSEKPGKVTAIEVLAKDDAGKIKQYRLVKKALGPEDIKELWVERLLCNRKHLGRSGF